MEECDETAEDDEDSAVRELGIDAPGFKADELTDECDEAEADCVTVPIVFFDSPIIAKESVNAKVAAPTEKTRRIIAVTIKICLVFIFTFLYLRLFISHVPRQIPSKFCLCFHYMRIQHEMTVKNL